MNFPARLAIIISLCLFPLFTATRGISTPIQISSSADLSSEVKNIEKPDKEKVLEDARKIGEEFKKLFKDLTEMSKNNIEPLVNGMSAWITDNYAKLSEAQREKLVEFIEKLKREYKDVEKMSLETMKDLLSNFKEFIDRLREGESQDSTEPLTQT